MKKRTTDNITSEVLAAFLDGNATTEESQKIIDGLFEDEELREILHISRATDAELGYSYQECEYIPMTALAATCNEGNFCCLECEKHILRKHDIEFDEKEMLTNAIHNGWQKIEGTALHNIGRHLESHGFSVTRKYNSTIKDIEYAIKTSRSLIAAVDGGELLGNKTDEFIEDIFIGEIPDHTVVILSYDKKNKTITIFDPNSQNTEDTYPIEEFIDAWNDSKNYLVIITPKDMDTYTPNPIDVSDVELSEELNELREAIAENAHEIWALERQAQGWTYGPQRDDTKKHNPCMVRYSQLPEKEKVFDREMAMNTLKLVKKLGYDIIKREDTELYKDLLSRIKKAKETYYCPRCYSKGEKTIIEKHQVFCYKCGHDLRLEELYKEL